MRIVELYEWIDESGDVESFLVIDIMSANAHFFRPIGAHYSGMFYGEDALALLRDYQAQFQEEDEE